MLGVGSAVGGACNMVGQITSSLTTLIVKPIEVAGELLKAPINAATEIVKDTAHLPLNLFQQKLDQKIETKRLEIMREHEKKLAYDKVEIENLKKDSELARQSKVLQAIQEYQEGLTELNVWADEKLGKNLIFLQDEAQNIYNHHSQHVAELVSKKQNEAIQRIAEIDKLPLPEPSKSQLRATMLKVIETDIVQMIQEVAHANEAFRRGMDRVMETIIIGSGAARDAATQILLSQAKSNVAGIQPNHRTPIHAVIQGATDAELLPESHS